MNPITSQNLVSVQTGRVMREAIGRIRELADPFLFQEQDSIGSYHAISSQLDRLVAQGMINNYKIESIEGHEVKISIIQPMDLIKVIVDFKIDPVDEDPLSKLKSMFEYY